MTRLTKMVRRVVCPPTVRLILATTVFVSFFSSSVVSRCLTPWSLIVAATLKSIVFTIQILSVYQTHLLTHTLTLHGLHYGANRAADYRLLYRR